MHCRAAAASAILVVSETMLHSHGFVHARLAGVHLTASWIKKPYLECRAGLADDRLVERSLAAGRTCVGERSPDRRRQSNGQQNERRYTDRSKSVAKKPKHLSLPHPMSCFPSGEHFGRK
jgi:hypothetical protein